MMATDPAGQVSVATLFWNTISSHHHASSPHEAVPVAANQMIIAFAVSPCAPVSA